MAGARDDAEVAVRGRPVDGAVDFEAQGRGVGVKKEGMGFAGVFGNEHRGAQVVISGDPEEAVFIEVLLGKADPH
jgi:hypothetical protein